MKKLLSAVALAAIVAVSSTPALAAGNFLEFTIDETSVPGTGVIPGLANSALVADKMNGGFSEYITIAGGLFTAKAYASIGQYFSTEGTVLETSLLSGNELVGGYRIYALFNSSGTVSGLDFTADTLSLELYIDSDSNTTFAGVDGNTAITLGNAGDDYKVAFSNAILGVGTGTLSSAPGAYNFDFQNLQLTSGDNNAFFAGNQNGEAYFVAPRPFHFIVQVNGDNDQATPLGGGTFLVTGDVSAVFKAPEPGSLALVGTLLAGLGLATRRRKV